MEEVDLKYMVEFNIPVYFEDDLEELLNSQKKVMSDYFYKGKIFSYTISKDLSKMWMVLITTSESELLTIIEQLPITRICDYDYSELMLHNTVQFIPDHSLN